MRTGTDRIPAGSYCVHALVSAQAERNPNAIAILAPGRSALTYGRLFDQVSQSAGILRSFGIERNDRVAIVLPNGPEMAVAFLTVASCAASAPLNPAYRAAEFDFYLSDLKAKALIVQSGIDSPARTVAQERGILIIELSPNVDAEAGIFSLAGGVSWSAAKVDFAPPDDVALVLHTSGTTSRPKLVPLTQTNICTLAHNNRILLKLDEKDRCLNVMPLFHIHGLSVLLATIAAGGSVACTPGFYAPRFFEWMENFRPTWYSAVPTMHQAILSRAAENLETIGKCPLRFVRSASAPLPPKTMAELEAVFEAPAIEAYGMTEASHQIASNPLPPGQRKTGSVGLAAGAQVAVMNEAGNLVPAGEVGELVIRGKSVMKGYENNPEANRNAFTNGWFRTGDQGYMDSEGYIFITGRLKEVINRGGEKISPREVDEVLMEHPAIDQAVTFALPDPRLGEDVGAAVVLRENASVTEREIREFAAQRLADFKVPRRVVVLDEIPKGPTGKLQRIGLTETLGLESIAEGPTGAGAPYAPPRSATEKKLAAMWADVLGLNRVGIHDEFLHLGGDSMLATLLVSRVREAFRAELSLLSFFEEAFTVARMCEWLANADVAQPPVAVPLVPTERDQEFLLSFAQERQWFIQELDPGNCAYNSIACIRFEGPLSVMALENSLGEIIRRHEALRTTYPTMDGRPIQKIEEAGSIRLRPIDLAMFPGAEREARAMQLMTDEARRPFNLSKDMPIRPFLLKVNGEEHNLLLTIHHIAYDGWSAGVLLKELMTLYEAFAEAKPSPLADLPIQYVDFATWQRQRIDKEKTERQLSYWERVLGGGLPVLDMPTDHRRPARQSGRGRRLNFSLPVELSRSVKELCRNEGSTLFMVLLAAYQCLLHRYSGQTDIIVGSPISGRTHVQTEAMIGMFINTLPLRTDLSGDPTFRELIRRVRKTALEAYENQDVPFQEIVALMKPERVLNHLPLFQVMFVLQNAPMPHLELPGLKLSLIDIDKHASIADLSLHLWDRPEGLGGFFEYDTELFDEGTIERMTWHFQVLLGSIVDGPERRVSELQMCDDAERHRLLCEWNDTQANYSRDSTIHGLFEAQVEQTPDSLAVVFDEEKLTYRELNDRANRLAHFLQSRGVCRGTIVGICMERSADMVVALLATLKAGGAYLPLDPTYPVERLAVILDESKSPLILTHKSLVDFLPAEEQTIVCLDADSGVIEKESIENPSSEVSAEDLAYVMFTSGSTGMPKGVSVPHRAVVRLVRNTNYIELGPNDRIAHASNCAFDAATFEIWGALLCGARIVGIPRDVTLSPRDFAARLQDQGVTTLFLTTALFNHMAAETPDAFKSLKHLLFGGEAVEPKWVKKVLDGCPPERLVHVYGPTENTTFSTWYLVEHVADGAGTIPIGRPISNTCAYVLDGKMQPVPVGLTGELYLGGDGLAMRYLNRPDLTAERFVSDPFDGMLGCRLYKTGDRVRYLPDGNIEFIGRLDDQVKMRGFRIEPEEVEIMLRQIPAVRETVVLAREDEPGNRYLAAYIIPEAGQAPSVAEIRNFLKQKLPDYMVPSAFVMMEAFPLTPNGKVDRRSLPVPERGCLELVAEHVEPRDAVELRLVKLWECLLDLRPIGMNDNFFELGGHSLLAARLFSQIEKMTGKALPLGTLIERPTVEQLADVLRKEGWSPQWESLVPIQPRGSKKPLFCVHPPSGNVFGYTDLARHLGNEQPLFGLQALGLDGKRPPFTRVEDMAAFYLQEIQSIDPKGPYLLCGRCSIGGLVAYEMAQQLLKQGEEVALLAMIDVENPVALMDPERNPYRHKSLIHYPRRNIKRLISYVLSDPQTRRFNEALAANIQAKRTYVPKVYPGRITYFFSEQFSRNKSRRFRPEVPGGWQQLAGGGLEIHIVPGGHLTMLAEPHVRVMAEKLKACMNRAT